MALKLVSVQTSQLCMENGISALRSVLLLKATMTKMTQTRRIRSQAKGFGSRRPGAALEGATFGDRRRRSATVAVSRMEGLHSPHWTSQMVQAVSKARQYVKVKFKLQRKGFALHSARHTFKGFIDDLRGLSERSRRVVMGCQCDRHVRRLWTKVDHRGAG